MVAITTVREMIKLLSPKPLRCPERFNEPGECTHVYKYTSQAPSSIAPDTIDVTIDIMFTL